MFYWGGSGGGNIWAEEKKKAFRDQLIDNGFAILTIGYHGLKGTPRRIDRINISAISDTIYNVAKLPTIDASKIALIGGSRGTELVLNLASRDTLYKAVVAIVPSHVSFPSIHTF